MNELHYKRPWLADYQLDAIFHDARYGLVEASTKSGKTISALVWIAEKAMAGQDGQNYWWIAPVYSQAEIAYRRMRRGLPQAIIKTNDQDRRITLPNGTTLWFKSGEKPDNLYGEDVYAAVVDEASRCREESWYALRSTLTATRGNVRIIGNVKGRSNWFYRLARRAEAGEAGMRHRVITAYDAVKAGILDRAEIDAAQRDYPEAMFKELYLAEAAELEGRVYSNFMFAEHVSSDVADLGGTVLVGMDFNVDPMTASLGSRAGDELHIWDEIVIRNGNTEEMASEIRTRYPGRDIAVYPDPSGKARKTSAPVGQTDFTILERHGFRVIAPNAAPAVVDRINEVQAMLNNSEGRRRLFIHPRCEQLIEALDGLQYKQGTSQPDKGGGLDHICDAIGYLIHMEFPIDGTVFVRRKNRGF